MGGTDPALAPMSMRVQAFEIIRTWLFYSVVQSELHFGRVPWRTALISGWGLSEQGKKLSKRDLDCSTGADGYNRYVPDDVMAKYGADALRLWATKGRIGTDLRYNEKDIRTGRKFAVKLWNVGRFLSMNLGDLSGPAPAPPPAPGGAEHRGPVGAIPPGRRGDRDHGGVRGARLHAGPPGRLAHVLVHLLRPLP